MLGAAALPRLALVLCAAVIPGLATAQAADPLHADPAEPLRCPADAVHAFGAPDTELFPDAASRGVRAEWCERYDPMGRSIRTGPYRERYPDGALAVAGHYRRGRLEGPVVAWLEDGRVFLRGHLSEGDWNGTLTLHHPEGPAWLTLTYDGGALEGPVLLRHPDGALAGETRFRADREQGLARSFYPSSHGGGLLSEVRVEDDRIVGVHRLFDAEGSVIAPLAPDDPVLATVPLPDSGPASVASGAPDAHAAVDPRRLD